MVVDSSNIFFLTLQDILNPDLSLMFGKMQVIKKYSRFLHFLLLWQDYKLLIMRNYFNKIASCPEKLLVPTSFLNLYTKSPEKSLAQSQKP